MRITLNHDESVELSKAIMEGFGIPSVGNPITILRAFFIDWIINVGLIEEEKVLPDRDYFTGRLGKIRDSFNQEITQDSLVKLGYPRLMLTVSKKGEYLSLQCAEDAAKNLPDNNIRLLIKTTITKTTDIEQILKSGLKEVERNSEDYVNFTRLKDLVLEAKDSTIATYDRLLTKMRKINNGDDENDPKQITD
jgi:hypothetical protein